MLPVNRAQGSSDRHFRATAGCSVFGRHGAAVLALTALAATSPQAMGAATITNLGVLPSGSSSRGVAVSSDGSVVVGWSLNSNFDRRAFRWTSAGGMVDLGVLGSDTTSSARSVSGDGTVVVGSGSTTGFRWTSVGGMQSLTPPVNSISGVSGDGAVLVGQTSFHAYRWTSGGGVQTLASLAGAGSSNAYAASANGSRIAGSSDSSDGERAVRWVDGTIQSLGVLAGGAFSNGSAISSDGTAVVGYSNTPSGTRAFIWTESSNTMTDLGVLAGGSGSYAYGVNGDGSVVVGQSGTGSGDRAMLWTSTLGMVDLNTYLVGLGVNLTGWTLTEATGISADGSTIVGYGSYQGATRGFVVNGLNFTPVPGGAGLAALACGATGLGRRRRA